MKIGRFLIAFYLLILVQWAAAQTPAEFRRFAENTAYDVWYGIYAMDQKLGYYHIVAALSEDREHYVVSEDMLVVSTFAGELSEDRSKLEVRYSLEDGLIDSSEAEESGGGERLLIKVERQGEKLKLTTNSGGRPESRLIDMSQTTLGEEMRFVEWMKQAKPGEKFESVSLDWSKEPVDTPQTFTFKSKESGSLNGVMTELYNLQEESFELTEEGQFDQKGVPVWQKTGGLFEIKREPQEVATSLGETPVEILAKTTVKSDVELGEPPLYELVLHASGLGTYKFPEATYQRVSYLPDGEARIEITPPKGDPEPSELGDREKYLKANPTLQANSPEIRRLVASLGLRGLSERKKVEKLTRWVYSNLEKASNVNASTSLRTEEQSGRLHGTHHPSHHDAAGRRNPRQGTEWPGLHQRRPSSLRLPRLGRGLRRRWLDGGGPHFQPGARRRRSYSAVTGRQSGRTPDYGNSPTYRRKAPLQNEKVRSQSQSRIQVRGFADLLSGELGGGRSVGLNQFLGGTLTYPYGQG